LSSEATAPSRSSGIPEVFSEGVHGAQRQYRERLVSPDQRLGDGRDGAVTASGDDRVGIPLDRPFDALFERLVVVGIDVEVEVLRAKALAEGFGRQPEGNDRPGLRIEDDLIAAIGHRPGPDLWASRTREAAIGSLLAAPEGKGDGAEREEERAPEAQIAGLGGTEERNVMRVGGHHEQDQAGQHQEQPDESHCEQGPGRECFGLFRVMFPDLSA
jgi:hypothetical protein